MMINRRRVYGGKSLPYDYEVEYLESDGTQYIQTNCIPLVGDSLYIQFLFYNHGSICLFSAGVGKVQCVAIIDSEPNIWVRFFRKTADRAVSLSANTWHSMLVNSAGTVFIDGSNKSYSTPTDEVGMPIRLFMRANGLQSYYGKIKSFYIENNGIKKIDLIPVVKNNVGYMYDKVSGTLFGNAGAGDFIVGPRVS